MAQPRFRMVPKEIVEDVGPIAPGQELEPSCQLLGFALGVTSRAILQSTQRPLDRTILDHHGLHHPAALPSLTRTEGPAT
jgi:hypothetical protein